MPLIQLYLNTALQLCCYVILASNPALYQSLRAEAALLIALRTIESLKKQGVGE